MLFADCKLVIFAIFLCAGQILHLGKFYTRYWSNLYFQYCHQSYQFGWWILMTISHHWFRWWASFEKVASHNLNHQRPTSLIGKWISIYWCLNTKFYVEIFMLTLFMTVSLLPRYLTNLMAVRETHIKMWAPWDLCNPCVLSLGKSRPILMLMINFWWCLLGQLKFHSTHDDIIPNTTYLVAHSKSRVPFTNMEWFKFQHSQISVVLPLKFGNM